MAICFLRAEKRGAWHETRVWHSNCFISDIIISFSRLGVLDGSYFDFVAEMSRHQAYRNLDFHQELADYDYRDEGDYEGEQNHDEKGAS